MFSETQKKSKNDKFVCKRICTKVKISRAVIAPETVGVQDMLTNVNLKDSNLDSCTFSLKALFSSEQPSLIWMTCFYTPFKMNCDFLQNISRNQEFLVFIKMVPTRFYFNIMSCLAFLFVIYCPKSRYKFISIPYL